MAIEAIQVAIAAAARAITQPGRPPETAEATAIAVKARVRAVKSATSGTPGDHA
jgi:hypothetical protein